MQQGKLAGTVGLMLGTNSELVDGACEAMKERQTMQCVFHQKPSPSVNSVSGLWTVLKYGGK